MPKTVNLFQARHYDWLVNNLVSVLQEVDFTESEVEVVGRLLGERLEGTNTKFRVKVFAAAWKERTQKDEDVVSPEMDEETLASPLETQAHLTEAALNLLAKPIFTPGPTEPDPTDELFEEEDAPI